MSALRYLATWAWNNAVELGLIAAGLGAAAFIVWSTR